MICPLQQFSVLAWLRERIEITYLGISDKLLSQCAVPLGDNLTITLSDSELAALPLMSQCFCDAQTQLGQWCSDLLRSGRKIELEALFNFATCKPTDMEAAFVA